MDPLIVLAEFDEPGQISGPMVQAGFQIQTLDTAEAALRFCGINPVSLVISRVVFRYGMTGVELVERLRSLASPPHTILITPHRSDRLRRIPGYPPRGVRVLRKPIVPAELLKEVQSVVSVRARAKATC
jgi:DNA-binding response OmpR family regulator